MTTLIDPNAHALRPIRIDARKNRFVNYEATTFPKDPRAGCEMYMRRLHVFGFIEENNSDLAIDVLSEGGDILQTIPISKDGFEYLRRQLKFKREAEETIAIAGGAA